MSDDRCMMSVRLIETLKSTKTLVKEGFKKALTSDPNFMAGLNVYKGNVTYKAVAEAFGHKYISPNELIA